MTSDNQLSYKASKDAHKNRCTYSCGNCGVSYSTELSVMLHIANAHPDSLSSLRVVREVTSIFRCRLCDDEFTYLSDFNSHMTVHGPRNKTTIPIIAERIQVTKQTASPPKPGKLMNVKKTLSNKTVSSAAVPTVPVHTRCFTCGIKFTEFSGFTALDSVNFCILPTPECTVCKEVFTSVEELTEHNKKHNSSGNERSKTRGPDVQENMAPVKLLKIEENANQQFKLYTCSACNVKFSNNITKTKKMLITCGNPESSVAYGVPLNGPVFEAVLSEVGELDKPSKRQHDSSVTNSESAAETGNRNMDNMKVQRPTVIMEKASVLSELLKRARRTSSQRNGKHSAETFQKSDNSGNVMSGILPDGSEFVIIKTEPSEIDPKITDTGSKIKTLNRSIKVKTEPKESASDDACVNKGFSDMPLAVTVKPDPEADSAEIINNNISFLEDEQSSRNNGNECKDKTDEIQPMKSLKHKVTSSKESKTFDSESHNGSRKNVITRSMSRKKQFESNIPLTSVITRNHNKKLNRRSRHGRILTKQREDKQEKNESVMDNLFSHDISLEGIGSLQLSENSELNQRVTSGDLDKLLNIERPFLYDKTPECKEEEQGVLVIKTEPMSPVMESQHETNIDNENKINIGQHTEKKDLEDNETDNKEYILKTRSCTSDNRTLNRNCITDESALLQTIKIEPDCEKWTSENSSVTEPPESRPRRDEDSDYQAISQLEIVNVKTEEETRITDLPQLHEIKKEKEDLSYEKCASQFPGIVPDSDSSDGELQDSRDPNLYSVSQVKQELDSSEHLLRIKRDLFCKKGHKRKYDDETSESETNIDSPYFTNPIQNLELKTEADAGYDPPKPVERIFVPQSMLGVQRMQLNDVLNSAKQKHVTSGSDLIDLLNAKTVPLPTTQKTRWRRNYKKRISDLIAGKEMTIEHRAPVKRYPNISTRRQRSSKHSYYGRKIAELTALNRQIEIPLKEKEKTVCSGVKAAENEAKTCQSNVVKKKSDSLPTKRRNFYEKRIAELRAFEDITILESETISLKVTNNSQTENFDESDDRKQHADYKKRLADLNLKLKAIRESQRMKLKSKSTNQDNSPCPTCKGVFADQDATIEHMRKVHGIKVVYKCDFCSKMFENKVDKVQHQFVHIEETKMAAYKMLQSEQFKCNICNTIFLFSQSLVEHFRKFHSEDQIETSS